jgi:hypothetical protein
VNEEFELGVVLLLVEEIEIEEGCEEVEEVETAVETGELVEVTEVEEVVELDFTLELRKPYTPIPTARTNITIRATTRVVLIARIFDWAFIDLPKPVCFHKSLSELKSPHARN